MNTCRRAQGEFGSGWKRGGYIFVVRERVRKWMRVLWLRVSCGNKSLQAAENEWGIFVRVAEICRRAKVFGRVGQEAGGPGALRWPIFDCEHETLYHGRQWLLRGYFCGRSVRMGESPTLRTFSHCYGRPPAHFLEFLTRHRKQLADN